MQSKATSVREYLGSLPDERRAAIGAVRQRILDNLDPGFAEGMSYGMIGYFVPHEVYPPGYHCDPKQPLPFAALASQKTHMSLYLLALYDNSPELAWFEKEWAKSGKALDMGKSCVRFKKLDDLALDVIASLFKRVTAKKYIASYEANLADRKTTRRPTPKSAKPQRKRSLKSTPAKKATTRKKAGTRRAAS
ncbi:MAG: DUF1801 domain-containing protein [Planctomycetota bacterium]|nr:DUF1801 domain-containing protein [Planctomycetota bacterium]